MINPICLKAGSQIAARASGLSPADGLWLEEHIHACDGCTREAELLSGMRRILLSAEPELRVEARNRAVRNALQAHRGTASPTSRAPVRPIGLGLGFAFALGLGLVAGALRREGGASEAPHGTVVAVAPRLCLSNQ